MKDKAKLKTCVRIPLVGLWGCGVVGCGVLSVRVLTVMGTKPTVEECADAFVLLAKSSSITGSSLKIGKFFCDLKSMKI